MVAESRAEQQARAEAVAENRRRSAIMAGMLPEPDLTATVAANVERIAAGLGLEVTLPTDPTLVDVERVAALLDVPVAELFLPA